MSTVLNLATKNKYKLYWKKLTDLRKMKNITVILILSVKKTVKIYFILPNTYFYNVKLKKTKIIRKIKCVFLVIWLKMVFHTHW